MKEDENERRKEMRSDEKKKKREVGLKRVQFTLRGT